MFIACSIMKVLFLNILFVASAFSILYEMSEDKLTSIIQLQDYELNDIYDDVNKATMKTLFGYSFAQKIDFEIERRESIHEFNVLNLEYEYRVSYDVLRNWTLLTKTGDFLLPFNEFRSLVRFHNNNLELSMTANITCEGDTEKDCSVTQQEYLNILASNRSLNRLNTTWNARQENYDDIMSGYPFNLQLVNQALTINKVHTSKAYWEMLSEYENGYQEAEKLWEDIRPLYDKLYNFVKIRLHNYYNISEKEPIPVYLMGDNFGTDWTNIADIVLPHAYLYDEIQAELKYWTVPQIYQLAESVTKNIRIGKLGRKFFNKSHFNHSTCGPYIFSNCARQQTNVVTCNKLGWKEYLDIHEASMDIALRNQDYLSLPRQEMHFSAADEALINLGSIFAVENLPLYNFVPKDGFKDGDKFDRKNTALLLMALRVLPKLAYYFSVDQWRLLELDFSYGNFTETWWEIRNKIQGVRCDSDLKADFLGDPLITSNKPYLSKFLGIFLEFQLADYYRKFFLTENGTLMDFIMRDDSFKEFIRDRPRKSWLDLISYHVGINKVSSRELLEYFRPLEKYFDSAPIKQIKYSIPAKVRTTAMPKKLKTVAKKNETIRVVNQKNETEIDPKSINGKPAEDPEVHSASGHGLTIVLSLLGVLVAGLIVFVALNRFSVTRRIIHRTFRS